MICFLCAPLPIRKGMIVKVPPFKMAPFLSLLPAFSLGHLLALPLVSAPLSSCFRCCKSNLFPQALLHAYSSTLKPLLDFLSSSCRAESSVAPNLFLRPNAYCLSALSFSRVFKAQASLKDLPRELGPRGTLSPPDICNCAHVWLLCWGLWKLRAQQWRKGCPNIYL